MPHMENPKHLNAKISEILIIVEQSNNYLEHVIVGFTYEAYHYVLSYKSDRFGALNTVKIASEQKVFFVKIFQQLFINCKAPLITKVIK